MGFVLFMGKLDNSIVFLAKLREQKLLTKWQLLNRIKFRDIIRDSESYYKDGKLVKTNINIDNTGGVLLIKDFKSISSQLKINYNTFRLGVKELANLGWLIPINGGYIVKGQKRIIKEVLPNTNLKKVIIYADTKKKLNEALALSLIGNSQKKQLYEKTNGRSKHWKKNKKSILITGYELTMSTRGMMKQLGYKSASTISKLQKRLERIGKLKVERVSEQLCHISEYVYVAKANLDLANRCFYKGDFIFERKCNILTIIR